MSSTEFQRAAPSVGIRELVTIWILFFINLFNYIDRYIVAGVLADLIDHNKSGFKEDLTFAQAGLLTTVFIVAYMILSPVFGFLGDRFKRSVLITIGLVLWAGSTFACSLVDEYWQLLVFRATVGVGEASYAALAPTIIADLIPPNLRTFYLSFFFIGTPVGGALGYIIGGAITGGGVAGSWRWAFRVSPPFCMLLAVLTIFLVQDPERGSSDHTYNDTNSIQQTRSQELRSPKNPVSQIFFESWTLIKIKSYSFATIGFAALSFIIGSLSQWVPVYVEKASILTGSDYSNDKANYVFGIMTCVAGLVAIPMGSVLSKFLERWTEKRDALICAYALLFSSVTLYIAIAVAPLSINYFWVFTFLTQFAIFLGWAPNTAIVLYTSPPSMRSLASAINILFSHLFGDALSPTIQGKLSDRIKAAFSEFDFSISDTLALEYSFFLSCFVAVLGSIFYFLCAESVIRDRLAAAEIVHSRHPTLIQSSVQNSVQNSAGNSRRNTILHDAYDGDSPLNQSMIREDPEPEPVVHNVQYVDC